MEQTVQSFKDLRKGVLNERSKDLFLAFLIAIIGFAGSYLVLGKSIKEDGRESGLLHTPDLSEFYNKIISSQTDQNQKSSYNFQEEYLLIQGTMVVGNITRITNLAFNSEKSYLIDFGNGIRHRMTSPVMNMRYISPGFYLLQCYVMQDNKWELLAAETITIRKGDANEFSGIP
jgi:hypothetical protein